MSTIDLLDKIQGMFSSMSPKEKQIAQYILQKNHEIRNMNISDMANAANVSNSSITRFCRKIGCESFVEMKVLLSASAQDLNLPEETEYTNIHSVYNRVIERTMKYLDAEHIDKIIEELEQADRIFINGVGSSGLTALELSQRLVRMGLNSSANTDSHLIIINSTLVNKGDLVIGITSSGATQEILSSFEIAKANGARIMLITSMIDTKAAELSDINLIAYNSSFVEDKLFVNTQFPMMYLIDIISQRLLKDEERSYIMSTTIDAILKKDHQ